MSTFSTKINIEAPSNRAWEVLADIGNIYIWNPGVVHSHATNDHKGIGASRHCDLGGKNYLDEDLAFLRAHMPIASIKWILLAHVI